MTREEAQNWLHKLYTRADITDEYGDMEDMQPYEEAINMAISALKDIEKIQFIVDTYFTRDSKSGYECMGEIDICECCGGQVNPRTMQCEYCGTQYKKENEEVFRIETFQGKVQTFQTAYSITDEALIRYPKEASEIALHRVVNQLAQAIAPYCEYKVEDDPIRRAKRIRARIKIVEPMNKGLRIGGEDI